MKQENLKLNIVFNILSQIVLYITPLIVAPYISRTLGATGVGEYSYAYSILYYFNIFIVFGFTSYGTKQIARLRDNAEERNKTFWGILFSRSAIFIVVSILYIFIVLSGAFKRTAETAILLALIPAMLSSAMDMSFLLQGVEKFRIISIVQVVVNVVYMACIFIFVKSYDDLILYTVIKSCIGIAVAIIQFKFVCKYISKPVIDKNQIKIAFRESFAFFLPTVIMSINPMLDQTLLGALADVKQVAYYEQTYKIICLVNMLVGAISPVMLSRVSYLYASGNIEECKKKIGQAMHLGYFIIIPAMVGLVCVAKYFVPAYFGDDFIPAVNVMYVLSVSVLFSPISSIIISSYYYPTHKVRLVTVLMAISIIANTIGNIFAIKYLGAVGAALTTSTLAILAHILYVTFSWKSIDYVSVYKSVGKILISAIVMALVIFTFNKVLNINSDLLITIIDVVIGAATYGVCCLILKEELISQGLAGVKKKVQKK